MQILFLHTHCYASSITHITSHTRLVVASCLFGYKHFDVVFPMFPSCCHIISFRLVYIYIYWKHGFCVVVQTASPFVLLGGMVYCYAHMYDMIWCRYAFLKCVMVRWWCRRCWSNVSILADGMERVIWFVCVVEFQSPVLRVCVMRYNGMFG